MTSDKTVFISYRRSVSSFVARAVFMDLRQHGFDVFMDVESINAGDFERIILNQIAARAHFILILAPGSLERCIEPGDWLRREIEEAVYLKRNVVPLLANSFSFSESYLIGALNQLPRYNALNVPHEYFDAAMERLRTRFLGQTLHGTIRAISPHDQPTVERKITRTATLPTPTVKQLNAEEYYASAHTKYHQGDMDGAIADYDEAIKLYTQYDAAYCSRGLARSAKGDFAGALADVAEALRLNATDANHYGIRAFIRGSSGDIEGALTDANEAVRLSPNDAEMYGIRAVARELKGDVEGAWEDANEAIRLNPRLAEYYHIRGDVCHARNDLDGAIADYDEAMRLNPHIVQLYYDRGFARAGKKDVRGAVADLQKYLELGGGQLNGDHAHVTEWIGTLQKQMTD